MPRHLKNPIPTNRVRHTPHTHGFSFIEVVALIALLGCILAIAIPTFLKALRSSKTTEASERLTWLYRNTRSYYHVEHRRGLLVHHGCVPPSAGPTPRILTPDGRFQEFDSAKQPLDPTWKMLGFRPHKVRFRYTFLPALAGCRNLVGNPIDNRLVFRAEADLDGDGVLSTYERVATIDAKGIWHDDPVLYLERPYE